MEIWFVKEFILEYFEESCGEKSVFDSSCKEGSGNGTSRDYDEIRVIAQVFI